MAYDKEGMQRDRDGGMSVVEIAKKHGTTPANVYYYTRAAKGAKSTGKLTEISNGGGKRTAAAKQKRENADSEFAQLREVLVAKRDKLDRAIEVLDGI